MGNYDIFWVVSFGGDGCLFVCKLVNAKMTIFLFPTIK